MRPTDRATHMVELLLGSIVLGLLYRLAARRFSTQSVLAAGLAVDTLLIAAMTAALEFLVDIAVDPLVVVTDVLVIALK